SGPGSRALARGAPRPRRTRASRPVALLLRRTETAPDRHHPEPDGVAHLADPLPGDPDAARPHGAAAEGGRMKSMILALSLLAPLAPSPLAERPAGSLRELRVVENDGRTEIVVRVAGEPRYRLFRRLSDPVDPRLTLEVLDAEAAALAARYPNVRRGGVRELRLTPTDSGTVQLAIGLAAAGPRAFGVVKRDGAIVVWMRNQDGPFAPWS